MKQLKTYLLAIIGCIVLTACPEDPVTPTGKNYTDTYNVPENGCNETYTLNKLNSKISSVSDAPVWLAVSSITYTSGAPKVRIIASPNEGGERYHTVSITTITNDKLELKVIQAAKSNQPGIEDIHNGTSGNPAYSKGKR